MRTHLFERLPEEEQLDIEAVEVRTEEVSTEMRARGFTPLTADTPIHPGVFDAAELRRVGGLGTIALPPSVFSAPVVLMLTAAPAERRDLVLASALLGPAWLALTLASVLQLIVAYYMHSSVVNLVSYDIVAYCDGETSATLRNAALLAFVALAVADAVETYEMHSWLCALPASDVPEGMRLLRFTERHEAPNGRSALVRPVSGITRGERAAFYFGCLLPKLAVAAACLVAGAGVILRAADDFELLQNSVAAAFTLQLDWGMYYLLVPDEVRRTATAMPAISSRSSLDANLRKDELRKRPLRATGLCGLVVAVAVCLHAFVWCSVGFVGYTYEYLSPATTDASFFVATGAAAAATAAWSAYLLLTAKTSRENLMQTYKAALRGCEHFTLDDSRFGEIGAVALAAAMVSAEPGVKELHITGQTPGRGVAALMRALATNTSLRKLSIHARLGNEEAKAVAALVGRRSAITHLDLASNRIGPEGLVALAKALKTNRTLTTLTLDTNEVCGMNMFGQGAFNAKGITKLVEILKANATLVSISLNGNQLCGLDTYGQGVYTDSGIAKLEELLKLNQTISSLSVQYNHIDETGKVQLRRAAGPERTLKL